MPILAAVALATVALFAAPAGAQRAEDVAITCTNPYSGASWQIRIDFRTPSVDANPAQVSAGSIAWTDAKDGGSYTLDRKSGELVARLGSSTGGYFRRARCNLEPAHGR